MIPFPPAFLELMRRQLGSEYDEFYRSLNAPSERALRLNPARGLDLTGDIAEWEPNSRYVPDDFKPGADLMHLSGAYYMQEASAMAPARALGVVPGDVVLDLCAAPGGKSGQLLAALGDAGALVSNEPEPSRCRALSSNLERLGSRLALVTCAYPDTLAEKWPETFDKILVDAPCSGEGMFRKNERARLEWTEKSPSGCAQRQLDILHSAAKMLKPGGRLVYSTCTFNDTENEGVAREFLSLHKGFRPSEFALPGLASSKNGMLRIWPHKARGEGHFIMLCEKAGALQSTPPTYGNGDPAYSMLISELPGAWHESLNGWRLIRRGDALCAVPPLMPAFEHIKTLRMGLHLCELGKGYIKPDHALAMALSPDLVEHSIELPDPSARSFAAGHELECPEEVKGWLLVTNNSLPLGFGKATNGRLKNHVPKGLRTALVNH